LLGLGAVALAAFLMLFFFLPEPSPEIPAHLRLSKYIRGETIAGNEARTHPLAP
jgi:hypothetical protein